MEKYNFTDDEIEVVENYLFKKIYRLEEAGLTDSYCYPRLVSFRYKLLQGKLKDDSKNSGTNKNTSR